MEQIFLDAQWRTETGRGKVKDLRDAGFIPAVIYGETKESKGLKIGHKQLLQLLHQHGLENIVINLKVKDDSKQARPCIIKDIQYDPVKSDIVHVDFMEISLTKAIKVKVPIIAKGEATGVKQDGGSLEHVMWEIDVECLPTAIPKEFEVDVSALKIGDAIHIKDLAIPSGIKVLHEPDAVVLSVAEPVKEEVVAPGEEGAEQPELEVIKEKKEVPGEGGAEGKEGKEGKEKK